jgi:hypothetical protein
MVVVLPKRIDTRDKAEFSPPELAMFDEDYWAARSEVPGDTPPESLALWRRILAVRPITELVRIGLKRTAAACWTKFWLTAEYDDNCSTRCGRRIQTARHKPTVYYFRCDEIEAVR